MAVAAEIRDIRHIASLALTRMPLNRSGTRDDEQLHMDDLAALVRFLCRCWTSRA